MIIVRIMEILINQVVVMVKVKHDGMSAMGSMIVHQFNLLHDVLIVITCALIARKTTVLAAILTT